MSSSSREYYADNSSTDEDEVCKIGDMYIVKTRGIPSWTQWRCKLNNKLIHVMGVRQNLMHQSAPQFLPVRDTLFNKITEPEIAIQRTLSKFILSRAVEDKREAGGQLILHPEAFLSFGIPRARLHGGSFRKSTGRSTSSFPIRERRYVTYSDE